MPAVPGPPVAPSIDFGAAARGALQGAVRVPPPLVDTSSPALEGPDGATDPQAVAAWAEQATANGAPGYTRPRRVYTGPVPPPLPPPTSPRQLAEMQTPELERRTLLGRRDPVTGEDTTSKIGDALKGTLLGLLRGGGNPLTLVEGGLAGYSGDLRRQARDQAVGRRAGEIAYDEKYADEQALADLKQQSSSAALLL